MGRTQIVGGWLLLSFLVCNLSGCATLLSDRNYEVNVSNSGGPTYFAIHDRKNREVLTGVTPQQVTLKSKAAAFQPARYHVVFAGQQGPQEKELKANVDWWTAGNIVLGGLPGFAIDAATGAMWKLKPQVNGTVPSHSVVSNPMAGSQMLAGRNGAGSPAAGTAVRGSQGIQPVSYSPPTNPQR